MTDYVKLSDAADEGVLCDPISGWSISGKQVVPYPTVPKEVKYVDRNLNLGVLLEASRAMPR